MTERQRNTAVGIFVIIGFVLLAILILQFNEIVMVTKGGYKVWVAMTHSRGAMPGKVVHMNGVEVGDVSEVTLRKDGTGVDLVLRIEADVNIPRNAYLRASPSGFGDVYLDIVLPLDPDGKPLAAREYLPKDSSREARLEGVAGSTQLIPESLTDQIERTLNKFKDVDKLLASLTELTEARKPEDVESGEKAPNLSSTVARLDAAMARLADDENTRNFKQALQDLAKGAAQLDAALKGAQETFGKANYALDKTASDVGEVKDKADRLLGKLYDDAVKISNLLDTFNSLAKGVQEGEGTVGKLLKSDELHKQLTLLVIQMNQTCQDISRLVTKLEQEGLMRKGG